MSNLPLECKESDLEVRIKMMQFLLCEIKVNETSPCTLTYCMNSIKSAIKDRKGSLRSVKSEKAC